MIYDQQDGFWEHWNTCAIEILPTNMKSKDSLFAVSLIKYSFDQATRSMRVIEAESDTFASVTQQEYYADEWFIPDTVSNANVVNDMFKLVSQDDGTQMLHFYDETVEQKDYSIVAANGEDNIQFQCAYWGH